MASHERAVEVDTQLAELWQEESIARGKVTGGLLYLQHAVGDKVQGWGWKYADPRQFTTTTEQAEERAREQAVAGTLRLQHRSAVESTIRMLDLQRDAIAAIRRVAEPLEAEYAADRWSRFFLVLNTNGHVHSSMHCSTCRVTTRFGWQPDLSGLTEADAVAKLGPKLCSVCFPSAPIEWIAKGRGA